MNKQVSERVLYAYFENKATLSEKQLIRQWLQEEGNEEIFYYHLSLWESKHLQFQPDLDQATQSFKEFLNGQQEATTIPRSTEGKRRGLFTSAAFKTMAVAASLLFVATVAFYLTKDFFLYDIYTTPYGMTQNILLEDGSEVTLNANSSLKVPKDLLASEMREVWLEGEAFFAIAKRPHKVRFSVHTENLNVEVLGTKFNVNNRRGHTEVVLDEGRVKLTSRLKANAAPVYMKPGDLVSLSASDTTLRRKVVSPEKYNAWQTNRLIFEDTPLQIVAEKIEDYYGVTIKFQNHDLTKRELTGTLPNNDLGVVLRTLSATHKLEIIREKDVIIFR
jgi:transmembrane sensor